MKGTRVAWALVMAGSAVSAAGAVGAEAPLTAAPASPAAAVAPRIAVEPTVFDFGRVLQHKTVQKEFTIRNHGGAELVIERVSTTCGCTAALPASKVVKPGGSTPLRVSLETRGASGKLTRSVLVRSNDPARPSLELKVEATVVEGGPN
ncbi:MAG: DUF1573 domain-containing protein [Myxococcaceae bacterium]|nr:DUF1573 domain-containing protein [Myxococcaceae bacterium]